MTIDASKAEEVEALIDKAIYGEGIPGDKLLSVCKVLRDRVGHYDWVGFYFVDPNEEGMLVLGPYSGAPTEHDRIPFGRGICGQAASAGKLFLVQDVSAERNYLSCSIEVKAEIVLPVFREGRLVGELDIDSHSLSPFDDTDRALLETTCAKVAPLFP